MVCLRVFAIFVTVFGSFHAAGSKDRWDTSWCRRPNLLPLTKRVSPASADSTAHLIILSSSLALSWIVKSTRKGDCSAYKYAKIIDLIIMSTPFNKLTFEEPAEGIWPLPHQHIKDWDNFSLQHPIYVSKCFLADILSLRTVRNFFEQFLTTFQWRFTVHSFSTNCVSMVLKIWWEKSFCDYLGLSMLAPVFAWSSAMEVH